MAITIVMVEKPLELLESFILQRLHSENFTVWIAVRNISVGAFQVWGSSFLDSSRFFSVLLSSVLLQGNHRSFGFGALHLNFAIKPPEISWRICWIGTNCIIQSNAHSTVHCFIWLVQNLESKCFLNFGDWIWMKKKNVYWTLFRPITEMCGEWALEEDQIEVSTSTEEQAYQR